MSKKIAVINDLSGFGRCSLVAAISTISAMGVQACPLPTSILSNQTAYPSYYCDDYTQKMEYIRNEWEKLGASFDGIYTGFVSNAAQIEQIMKFLDTFYNENTFLLVDPVMGDDGREYDIFTPEILFYMKKLVKKADIITPNLTELCMLTDTPYDTVRRAEGKHELEDCIVRMARSLMQDKDKNVIVTGIHYTDDEGQRYMANMLVTKNDSRMLAFHYVGGSFSGTGDLFASVIAGGIARGDDLLGTMELAGEFIECAMRDSVKENIEYNDGANYEKYLGMLIL